MKKRLIDTEVHKGHTVIRLNLERLDTQVSPQLKAEFLIVCKPPAKKLVIDMSNVKSCDSSGLSALLVAERMVRELKGEVHLVVPNEDVRNLFRITQLDKVFKIHASAEDAV